MNSINYEYEIIKHEIELGCPESAIEKECLEHPEIERKLLEEAEYHTHGQEHPFLPKSEIHYTPACENELNNYPEDPKMYNNWAFMVPR